jgi:predicted AlkP superfamily pyrophosphatase or phosphodiesterase
MNNAHFLAIVIVLSIISSVQLLDTNKKRVLLIGIDGLFKYCMNNATTTAFNYLMQEGSYTLNARTIIETASGPGWSATLCGLDTEDTGVFDNSWVAPWMFNRKAKITPITGDKPFPCVFSELKKNNPELKIKVTWNWSWLLNLGNVSIPGSIDKEYFCDPYPDRDITKIDECDKQMMENTIESIREDFDFMFLFFGSVDEAGHLFKFCSQEYIDRITNINSHIEKVILELKNSKIYENTYIILTSDHGASFMKNWHGEQDDNNIMIPFYMVGPGIKKNYELKDLVKNQDVAPTVLQLFGYSPNKLWRSRAINEAFESQNDLLVTNLRKEVLR